MRSIVSHGSMALAYSTGTRPWILFTVRIGYSVTASNDLSVIAMESRIIKSKTLPHHTNCIWYSDLGYSDKPVITIGRHEAKRTKLYKR